MTVEIRFARRLGLAACVALFAVVGSGSSGSAQEQSAPGASAPPVVQRPGPSGLPLPRFVSLRAPKANLRTGPGVRYPIEWVYTRPGLPLEVIAEFETWRRIRDWEGSVGWMHHSMLSGERRVMVLGELRLIRRAPESAAPGVALVEAGATARLLHCEGQWCRIEAKGFEGWLKRDEVYGVYPSETIR